MKRAFTIVEILVVMAVIGILITLAVIGISAVQKSQRETLRLNDLRNLKIALQDFYTKYRNYPPDHDWIKLSPDGSVCILDWLTPYGARTGASDLTCDVAVTGSAYFLKIKFNQQGGVIYDNDFANVPISTTVTAPAGHCENPMTADAWYVYYKTNLAPNTYGAQVFGLYACTENGLSVNFGELND